MNTNSKSRILGGVILVVLVAFATLVMAQSSQEKRKGKRASIFMRQKLDYCRNAIEGLTLENYTQIITNGEWMWNMSRSNVWETAYGQDYLKHSETFRDRVLKMIEAARAKDLDAARKSFGESLQSCYECHKFLKINERAKAQTNK